MSFDPIAVARGLIDAGGWAAFVASGLVIAFLFYTGRIVTGREFLAKAQQSTRHERALARCRETLRRLH